MLFIFPCSLKIVSASRVAKQAKRGARRGNSARAQVLGIAGTSPAAKARVVNAAKTASANPQPVEKIVVSNLPPDVNEAQVKVRWVSLLYPSEQALTFMCLCRSFFKLPSVLCVKSTYTTMQMVAPKA